MERAGVVALAALAPAAMLAVDPAGWYPFGPVKWLVVSTLVLSGAALVLRTRALSIPTPVLGGMLALLGQMAFSAAGGDGIYAWIGTPERRFGVLTWGLCVLPLAAGSSLDAARHGPILVHGLLVAGVGVGVLATAEALGWEPDVLDAGSRLTGPFGSAAYLGASQDVTWEWTDSGAIVREGPQPCTVTTPLDGRRVADARDIDEVAEELAAAGVEDGEVTDGSADCASRAGEAEEGAELGTYTWEELGIDAELRELVDGRTYAYVSDDGQTFQPASLPDNGEGWTADLVAVADGYRLLVGTPTG